MIDAFFNTLKKSFVLFLFLVVGFAMTYVPQAPSSHVQQAEAGGLSGMLSCGGQPCSNLGAQVSQIGIAGKELVESTLNAGANVSNWIKENALDGLGWHLAKRMITIMMKDIIDWVNGGGNGTPRFLQDMRGFLTQVADEELGRIISDIDGGNFAFLCSPFRLDVKLAIETRYTRSQSGADAPACTATNIVDNIKNFGSGVSSRNTLADWLTITSAPGTYTEYGSVLTAEATLRARIINAQGDEVNLLGFGDGFFSTKICADTDTDTGTKKTNCSITLPGKAISEQLHTALGSPVRTAEQVDEFGETLNGLFSRFGNAVLNQGLTKLSSIISGGNSFLDQVVNEADQAITNSVASSRAISDALTAETDFQAKANSIRSTLAVFASDANNNQIDRATALATIAQIDAELQISRANITQLNSLFNQYATATDAQRVGIIVQVTSLNTNTAASTGQKVSQWTAVSNQLGVATQQALTPTSLPTTQPTNAVLTNPDGSTSTVTLQPSA